MNNTEDMSVFAKTIMEQKYSHTLKDGTKETWNNIAYRVSKNVMKAVNAPKPLVDDIYQAIKQRKFMPGGRYLYASGKQYHQTQNCLLLKAEDSREGWSELLQKSSMALMTGAGIGIDYSLVRAEGKPIRKTGGTSTGPLALMQMINETGRGIVQGGARRSAIWAGLSWNHADIHKFITMKNWSPEVKALKEKDFYFPATMDGTNISVLLDDDFFEAFDDSKHVLHSTAHSVYWSVIEQMLKTGEPGFSVDVGKNSGETLRNAPVCGETNILTNVGYKTVESIINIPVSVWTGNQWAHNVFFKQTNSKANILSVNMSGGRNIRCDETHPFLIEKYIGKGKRRKLQEIIRVPANQLKIGDVLHISVPIIENASSIIDSDMYTLGYCYGDGSFKKTGSAEITLCSKESKSCLTVIKTSSRISSINECDSRGYTRIYFKTDRKYFGSLTKINVSNTIFEASTEKICAFLAGLFDADGNWEKTQNRIRLASKHKSFLRDAARLLEQIGIISNISKAGFSTFGKTQGYQLVIAADYNHEFIKKIPTVRLNINLENYKPYRKSTIKVLSITSSGIAPVYCANVGVDEHSFMAEGVIISNCTEVTSKDDSDICNLGSINLARIDSLEEMEKIVELGIAFLLAGTVYSDVPYTKVDHIRTKNRRLGLGLMGIHEWLLLHGKKYEKDDELKKYLEIYQTSTQVAKTYADKWELSPPIKTRAIAPTGTIGIIGETTTGIEPIFCAAYKRRYKKGTNVMEYQYVIDPTAKKIIDNGALPENVEDAYVLAENPERRVAFQAWVQQYVDHSISSTINLPAWGTELNNSTKVTSFGNMLIKYLPQLRGITVYPDASRGGQPLTPVKYSTAAKHLGEVFIEQADMCDITKAGSCGS